MNNKGENLFRYLQLLTIIFLLAIIPYNLFSNENSSSTLYIFAIDGSQTMYTDNGTSNLNKWSNICSFFDKDLESTYNFQRVIEKLNMKEDTDYFTLVKFGFGEQFQKNHMYMYTSLEDYLKVEFEPEKANEKNINNSLKVLDYLITQKSISSFFNRLSTRLFSLEYFATLLTTKYDYLSFNRIVIIRISDEIVNSESFRAVNADEENRDAFAFLDNSGYKSNEEDLFNFYDSLKSFNQLFTYYPIDLDFKRPDQQHIRICVKELEIKPSDFNFSVPIPVLNFETYHVLEKTYLFIKPHHENTENQNHDVKFNLSINNQNFGNVNFEHETLIDVSEYINGSVVNINYGVSHKLNNKYIKGMNLRPQDYPFLIKNSSVIPISYNKYFEPFAYIKMLKKIYEFVKSPDIQDEISDTQKYIIVLIISATVIVICLLIFGYFLFLPTTKVNKDWEIKSISLLRPDKAIFSKKDPISFEFNFLMETKALKYLDIEITIPINITHADGKNVIIGLDCLDILSSNFKKNNSMKFYQRKSNNGDKKSITLLSKENNKKLYRGRLSFTIKVTLDLNNYSYSNPSDFLNFTLNSNNSSCPFSIWRNKNEVYPEINFTPNFFYIDKLKKEGIYNQRSHNIVSQSIGTITINNISELYNNFKLIIKLRSIPENKDNAKPNSINELPFSVNQKTFNYEYILDNVNIPIGASKEYSIKISSCVKCRVKLFFVVKVIGPDNITVANFPKETLIKLNPPRNYAVYFDKGTSANAINIRSYDENNNYAEIAGIGNQSKLVKINQIYARNEQNLITSADIPNFDDEFISTLTFFDFMKSKNDSIKYLDKYQTPSQCLFKIPRLNSIAEPENIIPSEKYFIQYEKLPNLWELMNLTINSEDTPEPGYYDGELFKPLIDKENLSIFNIPMDKLYLQTTIQFLDHYMDLKPEIMNNTSMQFFISLPNNTLKIVKEKIEKQLVGYYQEQCEVSFISESDAVALNILNHFRNQDAQLTNRFLLVIDIGAGTTDLSLIKWSITNRWDVEVLDRFSYNIAGDAIDSLITQAIFPNYRLMEKRELLKAKNFINKQKKFFTHNDQYILSTSDKKTFKKDYTSYMNKNEDEINSLLVNLSTFWKDDNTRKYLIDSIKEAICLIFDTRHVQEKQKIDVAIVGRGSKLAGYSPKIQEIIKATLSSFNFVPSFIIPERPKGQVVEGLKIYDDIFYGIGNNKISNIDFGELQENKFLYGFYCNINKHMYFFERSQNGNNQFNIHNCPSSLIIGNEEAYLELFKCSSIIAKEYKSNKNAALVKESPFYIHIGKYQVPRKNGNYSVELIRNDNDLTIKIDDNEPRPVELSDIDFSKNIGYNISLWPFTNLPNQ